MDGARARPTAFAVSTIVSHFRDGTGQPEAKTGEQARALAAYMRDAATAGDGVRPGTDVGIGAARRGPLRRQGRLLGVPHRPDVHRRRPARPARPPGGRRRRHRGRHGGPLLHAFNTAQLRDVASTAPYMHNGSLATLRDVVRFYNEQSVIAPLGLTDPEIDDLVAYLESL